jgi:hypothetical protein
MPKITIPYNWKPRNYQMPTWAALESGIKRVVQVWHRRTGKDLFDLNWLISEACEKPGTYWHIFPTYKQGKKAIWDESTVDGRKYLDHIPPQLISSKNDQEMKIKLVNGSVYQIIGGDDPDALRGAGIKGAIVSEYAEQRPSLIDLIEPMLLATKGFLLVNFTPKGKNHAYRLYEMAKINPKWHASLLTADDTKGQVFTEEDLQELKTRHIAEGKSLALFEQEYYCSFEAPIDEAYYGEQIAAARKEGRICRVPHDPNLPVQTIWDIGYSDTTSIIFTQVPKFGSEVRIIDYYQNSKKGMEHYARVCKAKPYMYSSHNGPHDLANGVFATGESTYETAKKLGINFEIVAKTPVQDGINALRALFPRLVFDEESCKDLIAALEAYESKFDEKKNDRGAKPVHNWASHAADAGRYLAVHFSRMKTQLDNLRPLQLTADYFD